MNIMTLLMINLSISWNIEAELMSPKLIEM